jgi:hypothetical protein
MKMKLRTILTGSCLAGLGLLAACNQSSPSNGQNQPMEALAALPSTAPMQPGPATPIVAAPAAGQLPEAPQLPLRKVAAPADNYAYIDRAVSYDDAIGDAPPDYAFDYGDVTPWGWQASDGSIAYVEPVDQGYRYYYYEPGADEPYFVRDPHYSYAYDGPSLVAVYDSGGRLLPWNDYGPRRDYADRYFVRARAMREAARHHHRGIVAANWAERRGEIAAANARLDAARRRDLTWASYHDRVRNRENTHWQADRRARRAAAQRFADYQRRGFEGRPPNFGPVRQPHQNQGKLAAQQRQQKANAARAGQQRQHREQAQAAHRQQLAAQHRQAVKAQVAQQKQTRQAEAQQRAKQQQAHQQQARRAQAAKAKAAQQARTRQAQAQQRTNQQQAAKAQRLKQQAAHQQYVKQAQAAKAKTARQARAQAAHRQAQEQQAHARQAKHAQAAKANAAQQARAQAARRQAQAQQRQQAAAQKLAQTRRQQAQDQRQRRQQQARAQQQARQRQQVADRQQKKQHPAKSQSAAHRHGPNQS